jgi:hypothetical protein
METPSTRLHVDELVLDYLLWYCTSSLLVERRLRAEGNSNKCESTDAARNSDAGMKLVNSSFAHASCFYSLCVTAAPHLQLAVHLCTLCVAFRN